jgi:hypothetical protein
MNSAAEQWEGIATVVDFVTVKTSGFNSFQHPEIFDLLNLKELREDRRVEHLVPNQIRNPVECCGILLFLID